jgi:hypothetical protein
METASRALASWRDGGESGPAERKGKEMKARKRKR